jgi:hypothetical protein
MQRVHGENVPRSQSAEPSAPSRFPRYPPIGSPMHGDSAQIRFPSFKSPLPNLHQ